MAVEGILSTDASQVILTPESRTARTPLTNRGLNAGREAVKILHDRTTVALAGRQAGEVAALARGKSNAIEALSVLQVADKALSEIETKLDRLKTLATDASNSLFKGETTKIVRSKQERAILQAEFDQLRTEISDIVNNTKFGNLELLKGASPSTTLSLAFSVGGGTESEDVVTVNIDAATLVNLSVKLPSLNLDTALRGDDALTEVNAAITKLGQIQSSVRAGSAAVAAALGTVGDRSALRGAEVKDRLATRVEVDFAQLVAEQSLEDRGISELLHDSDLLRSLLAVAATVAPAPLASQPTAPATSTSTDDRDERRVEAPARAKQRTSSYTYTSTGSSSGGQASNTSTSSNKVDVAA